LIEEDEKHVKSKEYKILNNIINNLLIVRNYHKYNHNNHTLLILAYFTLKYYHYDKNVETNKNDLIFFINKIVPYNNALKNRNIFHYYKEDLIKSFNNLINHFQYISLIKTNKM